MNSVHWNAERRGPIPSDKVISSATESTATDTDGPPGPLPEPGGGEPGLVHTVTLRLQNETMSFKDVQNDVYSYLEMLLCFSFDTVIIIKAIKGGVQATLATAKLS